MIKSLYCIIGVVSGQARDCLLPDNHEDRYYLQHGSGHRRLNRQPPSLDGEGGTGLPGRTK